MNELEELESIVALEDEDWEASRLAEVFIDMVKSREAGELTEAEFKEMESEARDVAAEAVRCGLVREVGCCLGW